MNIIISQGIFENGSIFVLRFCMIFPSEKEEHTGSKQIYCL